MTAQVKPKSSETAATRPPARLHHAAYVSADQERTRHFYEDILEFPLVAFWTEREEIFGEMHEFSHAFYGLEDGGALAFFNFSYPEHQTRYTANRQEVFVHLALKTDRAQQDRIRQKLKESGLKVVEADHGFAYYLYVTDPDGQLIEFTVDPPHAGEIDRGQRRTAREALRRWQSGDRTPNNELLHTGQR